MGSCIHQGFLVRTERDPDELTNQYANPKYASVIAELKKDVDKLRSHYADNTDISVMAAEWQKKFRHKSTSAQRS